MTHTVVGLFDSKNAASQAIEELTREGFIREHIDMSAGRVTDDTAMNSSSSTTTGRTDTGVGDSISNFFGSLFGSDDPAARTYTEAARGADAILTVQVDSVERAQRAAEILDRNGAIDVDERSSQYAQSSNFAETNQNTSTNTRATNATSQTGETAIPIIEEELQIGKRQVERGGARVRSRVIEKPVEEHVRLREEHIVVQRRPVNRAVTDADVNNFREGEIELTERAEEAVVNKQARVVEEVVVGKQVEEHDQVVRDTVRRTDVDVQEYGTNADVRTGSDATTTTDENINKRRANS